MPRLTVSLITAACIILIIVVLLINCSDDKSVSAKPELWCPLGSGMNNEVLALIAYNDRLIAGGKFTMSDEDTVNYIAAWDGSKWVPLGTGMNGIVHELTVYEDKLIVGGGFTEAGGVRANHIAAWDGSTWTPLG